MKTEHMTNPRRRWDNRMQVARTIKGQKFQNAQKAPLNKGQNDHQDHKKYRNHEERIYPITDRN